MGFALEFSGNHVSTQKRGYYCAWPASGCVSNGFQRFQFGLHCESVARFGLNGRRALFGHFAQRLQNVLSQLTIPCLAHVFHARPDAAPRFRNLFIGRARNAFFEIDEAWRDKGWMSVGIDETGENDLVLAVDL